MRRERRARREEESEEREKRREESVWHASVLQVVEERLGILDFTCRT